MLPRLAALKDVNTATMAAPRLAVTVCDANAVLVGPADVADMSLSVTLKVAGHVAP